MLQKLFIIPWHWTWTNVHTCSTYVGFFCFSFYFSNQISLPEIQARAVERKMQTVIKTAKPIPYNTMALMRLKLLAQKKNPNFNHMSCNYSSWGITGSDRRPLQHGHGGTISFRQFAYFYGHICVFQFIKPGFFLWMSERDIPAANDEGQGRFHSN